ncbi:antibiotic biosynthesis monooxygenase [Streptosporangium sp. NBC_01639]|uniref:antibiotic biosynthesis monooxygenase n=1 Tax=unclassified Streptosporangium TaxID=2632669 RepID=UPI002DD8439C|nr:antibiotic biosynthesis monooxygenase [Streptosporangium sp. NBC_01756]WSC90094.1 antibiotic biosynthesis monooxygenase [Streptosporangium sp. NBC_01756]WTD51303.1 antibiotic biosynthesis monooxygenase [Streptosporangium sp. NBC_01639]
MPLISITRFHADPADAEQVRARHAALVTALRTTLPGLTEARLGRLDDETWVGVWRWDSAASLRAARQAAPATAAATEAFALVRDVTAEDIEVLAEL